MTSLESRLSDLRACLTVTRRADGTTYTHLSDAAFWDGDRNWMEAVIHVCHGDELPNEWRYSTIDHIVNGLLDRCEPDESFWDIEAFRDVSWEVAESGADISTSDNLAWLAESVTRATFRDSDVVASMPEHRQADIGWLARMRQIEEIEWMVHTLLDAAA